MLGDLRPRPMAYGLALVGVLLGCGRSFSLLPTESAPEGGDHPGDPTAADGVEGSGGMDGSGEDEGSADGDGPDDPPTTEPPPPLGFVQLAAGGRHACGVWSDQRVHCWGGGWLGQIGNGAFEDDNPAPVAVLDLPADVVQIGAGKFHTCATLGSGAVMCWGHNVFGALGNDDDEDSPRAVAVVGLPGPALGVSGGVAHLHTCAALEDGTMACWGENQSGQLGNGTQIDAWTPQLVLGLQDVRDFAIGYIHTCAVDAGGQVRCWGWNPHGLVESSMPSEPVYLTPWPKAGLTDVVQVSAGNHHACALHEDGRVSCWGYEGHGQLGDGSDQEHGEPLPVADLFDAVELAGGATHNCAVRLGGTIACWGYNYFGQLGDGTTTTRPTPVEVVGIDDASAVTVGDGFTCALSPSQGALCWGQNDNGQLGDGTTLDSPTPVPVLAPG